MLVLMFCSFGSLAKDEPLLSIGVARIDITPGEPVRLHGYGGRRTNSQGVAQPLFAKALAFGTDRQGASILFTVDNLAVPGAVTDEVAARLKKRAKIDREKVALCSSHTHSAPMLTGAAPNIFSSDIIPEQLAAIDRYTRELVDKLERVALAALSNRAPSKLSWAEGTVKFAKNRRVVRPGGVGFGDNEGGPVDHTLATMFVHGADGKLRGVLVNYACHCTTLGGEWNKVHGDWSGCAQEAMERDNPGAIALVSIGCGADANPSPRGKVENAIAHGEEIAAEVKRLLELEGRALRVPDQTGADQSGTHGTRPSKRLTKLPDGKLKRFDLDFDPLPTRAQWEERGKKPGIVGYHAKKNLARLDRGEKLPTKLPYSVATWTFGDDLAMVFLPGEVVIDYQRRLKREFDSTRLWVNGYANDVPCYIPSRRILTEGGYEAEDSLWYYDRPARLAMSNEDRIIKAVHDLLPRKFRAKTTRAEGPQPLSPRQALSSMRVAPEFTVDLVAAEPIIVDPVAIDWGADGKLWVAEMRDYPMGMDGNWKPGGVVKFLEDKNGDGHYDKATVFLDKLPFPTGVFAWRKGVLICAAPDIIYAEDTNGDGRADVVKKVFTGFATNNYQARVNSLSLGLDNWIYGANGLLGGDIRFVAADVRRLHSESRIDQGLSTSAATNVISIRGRDFRMNPDTGAFEPASGLTQQGRVRDDFGNWFGCDNSHLLWHYPLADEYVRRNPYVAAPNPAVQVPRGRDWNRLYPASQTLERFNDASHVNRVTSACGLEIYRDELLGREFYGNAFICEPVHNLVHREVLTPDGVTFRSTRATNELNREFLASTDNWFRPAQARTGPDGALWVVDMYRYVIEHPRWIPSNRLAQLNVRAGDDKGRIYRVYRKDSPPRPIKNFAKLHTPALAAALDSPNGTERDIIHRELLNRGNPAVTQKLLEVAANSPRAGARVQALSALEAFNAITPELLSQSFHDSSPEVRQHVLRIAESKENLPSTHRTAAQDKNMGVRHQAALSLSRFEGFEQWFAPLLSEATTNSRLRAAILTAPRVNGLIEIASRLPASTGQVALSEALLSSISYKSAQELVPILDSVLPQTAADAEAWRFRAGAKLLERYNADEYLRSARNDRETWEVQVARRVGDARELARTAVTNRTSEAELSRAALMLLSRCATESDVRFIGEFLSDSRLQQAALDALVRVSGLPGNEPDELLVADTLTSRWSGFSPRQREQVAERCLAHPQSADAFLKAVAQNAISPNEVSVAVRTRLLNYPGSGIRETAQKLWPKRESNRAKVIAEYRKAATRNSDVERGSVVFNDSCASCHTLSGRGSAIGPDLAAFRDKSAEDFLVAILDPNAALEPRYLNYIVETKNGGAFYGVIRSETATSLEIVAPGIQQTLLRGDIARIHASPLSLMPEGIEQNITPSQMNDLIAFLKKPAPRVFGSATGELIEAARQEFRGRQPDGLVKLISASEQLDYPSWLGRLPLWHCRQSDGKSRIIWQPGRTKASGTETVFMMPAAMGFISQPSGTFTLKVNGSSALEFNVTLDDNAWQSADGKFRASYRVMEANAQDSNGVLTIAIANALIDGSKPVTLEVVGSAANSQRWFGIYDFNAVRTTASR